MDMKSANFANLLQRKSVSYKQSPHLMCRLKLTYERYSVSSDGQQVVHDEQEDSVAQDEGHLEGGPVHSLWGQQEAEEVHCDEEAAGDQQVHHIQGGPAPHSDLRGGTLNKDFVK